MKKGLILLMVMTLLVILPGCGESDVSSVKAVNSDATDQSSSNVKNTPNETDSDSAVEETEPLIFKTGETVYFGDAYTLTITGVHLTEERNQYSEEVSQVVVIDYVYENLNSQDEDIHITDMNFKFVDEGGNMCDSYPVSQVYSAENTPVGGLCITSMSIGTIEESQKLRVLYYDNMFNSTPNAEFELNVNESSDFNLIGELPEYTGAFKIGEIIEIGTDSGDYTLTIDSVEVVEDRNDFDDKEPIKVFKIGYTYSNINKDSLYISDMNFRVIDGNAVMAYTYPGSNTRYPQDVIPGAKTSADMFFGTHTDTDKLVLCFSDNMFNDVSDFKILLEGIE